MESTGTGHQYWQEIASEGEEGSMILWTRTTNGYVKNPEDWMKGVKMIWLRMDILLAWRPLLLEGRCRRMERNKLVQ